MLRLRHSYVRAVIAFATIIAAGSAHGASCNVPARPIQVTATSLSFGNYNATSPTANTSTMTVTVQCVRLVDTLPAFVVALSKGSSSTYTPRTMTSGANTLQYNIFNSTAYTSVWGDGTGGTQTRSYPGSSTVRTATGTGYGRIPAGQYVAAGSYTDTITVTVTY